MSGKKKGDNKSVIFCHKVEKLKVMSIQDQEGNLEIIHIQLMYELSMIVLIGYMGRIGGRKRSWGGSWNNVTILIPKP